MIRCLNVLLDSNVVGAYLDQNMEGVFQRNNERSRKYAEKWKLVDHKLEMGQDLHFGQVHIHSFLL